ncbi:2-hydroxyacid dehydrogenase [Sedimentitalea todarodis]|uniref:2-hydroxyacid dehydrogenase n=1 Tax=Sedimentitalea todarodis TaxID=1631240 RepID=A0ABU3VHT1_9RHOB|nr:2-hydroxyacid dehydrogenase [Sedimentitalea todarodis]MDU9005653.1 2-hydroxyacid dehydrogenase [Sedimentitalea todarodis]
MTGKPDLLMIGSVTDRMMARLTAEFTVHPLFDQPDEARFLADHGAAISAVLTNGHDGLRPDLMAALPNLKIVSSYGVGYDAIDATAAAERGIVVTHTPNVLNDEVANTALLLWFAVSRRLVPNDAYVRAGRWENEGNTPLTHSVQSRMVGIVGLGRIGQAIADRLAVFDSTVLYHARSPKNVSYRYYANLTEMAADSDVLICITPGGPETKHLINKPVIDALGPDGILVNVSRGSVVDETAMVEALKDGRLGGAGLDVFDQEPRVPADLLAMDNVVLQPHVGSATHETRQAMGDLTCDNLSQWLKDGTTVTPVPECQTL